MVYRKCVDHYQEIISDLMADNDRLELELEELKTQLRKLQPRTKRELLGTDLRRAIRLGRELRVAPEKQNEIETAQDRIQGAVELYTENFDESGNATTDFGVELEKKYRYW